MSKPIFQLIAKDSHADRDGWAWMAVIHFTGKLQTNADVTGAVDDGGNPEHVSEDQIAAIYQFLEGYDIHVRAAGGDTPGQPFANEPWIQFFPTHLIVTQNGGLNV